MRKTNRVDPLVRAWCAILSLAIAPAFAADAPVKATCSEMTPDGGGIPTPVATKASVAPHRVPAPARLNAPWENSLGMKFVPVPGTRVLFSVWETRVQDYAAFVAATGRAWEKMSAEQAPEHPAGNVNWEDSQAFCAWLTEKERREGRLSKRQRYRLPKSAEWSVAVSLGRKTGGTPQGMPPEAADIRLPKDGEYTYVNPGEPGEWTVAAGLGRKTLGEPEQKPTMATSLYPWGTQWPPPQGAGNYDISLNVDNYFQASPVGSFASNRFGLYDMGGNVWEWCENEDKPTADWQVLRGASWGSSGSRVLVSSFRYLVLPSSRFDIGGFRCVLSR